MKSSGTSFNKKQRTNAPPQGFPATYDAFRDNLLCLTAAGLQQQITTLKQEKTHVP
jgi:hypothetical protein